MMLLLEVADINLRRVSSDLLKTFATESVLEDLRKLEIYVIGNL